MDRKILGIFGIVRCYVDSLARPFYTGDVDVLYEDCVQTYRDNKIFDGYRYEFEDVVLEVLAKQGAILKKEEKINGREVETYSFNDGTPFYRRPYINFEIDGTPFRRMMSVKSIAVSRKKDLLPWK